MRQETQLKGYLLLFVIFSTGIVCYNIILQSLMLSARQYLERFVPGGFPYAAWRGEISDPLEMIS